MSYTEATEYSDIADFLESTAPLNPALTGAKAPASTEEPALHQEVLEMYQKHSPYLLRFARIMTGEMDSSLAQDAVQEAFFDYFLYRRQGHYISNARWWLQQKLKEFLARNQLRGELDSTVAAGSRLEISAVSEMLLDVQRRLPHLLSPRELQAMRLRAQGFRYVEIAEALHVTVGTVGTMIARAVKKLQSEFGPKGPGRLGN